MWRGLAQHVDSASNHEKEVTISCGLDYDFNNGFALGVCGIQILVLKTLMENMLLLKWIDTVHML